MFDWYPGPFPSRPSPPSAYILLAYTMCAVTVLVGILACLFSDNLPNNGDVNLASTAWDIGVRCILIGLAVGLVSLSQDASCAEQVAHRPLLPLTMFL